MKKISKKVYSLVLVFCLFLINLSPISVFAAEEIRINNLCEKILLYIEESSLSYAQKIEESLSVDVTIPIIDSESNYVGHMVSFADEQTPYGYIIINPFTEDTILEYSIIEGRMDLYNELLNESDIQEETYELLIQIGLGNYAITDGEQAYYKSNSVIETYDVNMPSSTIYNSSNIFRKYVSSSNMVLTLTNSGYTITQSPKLLSNYVIYSQEDIERQVGKYACGITALAEIVMQTGINKGDSLNKVYNDLWNYGLTHIYKSENGIPYGENTTSNLASAFRSYARGKGYSSATSGMVASPTSTYFKNAVNDGYSSMLSYCIYVKTSSSSTDDEDYEVSCHAISVIGYAQAKSNSTGAYNNFLIVANGWNSYPTYINYTQIDMFDTYGITCYV